MSRRLLFTEAARQQVRSAIEALRRRDRRAAGRFVDDVEACAEDPDRLCETGARLSEFPDLPYREVLSSGYRVFFRAEGGTLWIAGVWRAYST